MHKIQHSRYVVYDDTLELIYEFNPDTSSPSDWEKLKELLRKSILFLTVDQNYYYRIIPSFK